MSNRILRLVFLAALIAASACTPSRVPADADIAIAGEVRREADSPAAGARVFLSREGDLGEALVLLPFLGLPCLAAEAPPICDKGHLTTAADDGSFAFEVKGSYTQGFTGQAATLALQTRLPRAEDEIEGPAVTTRFQVQTERLSMPMSFWEPELATRVDGYQGMVTWSELPSGVVPPDVPLGGARTSVRFHQQGVLVWGFRQVESGMTFDARLLENSRGDFSVSSVIDDVDVPAERGTKLSMVLRSARLPYAGTAGPPWSRGKGCSAYNAEGQAVALSPCALTDGDFSASFDPPLTPPCPEGQDCPAFVPKSAFVDLGEPRPVELVVLRGCESACRLETSDDGATWRPFAVAPGSFGEVSDSLAITPPRPTSARMIRITADDSIANLREVSVWDPSPPPAPGENLVVPLEQVPEGRAAQEEGGGQNLVPLIAAAAAVLVLLLTILIVSRRRRS